MPTRTARRVPLPWAVSALSAGSASEDRQASANRALGVFLLRVRVAEINQHAVAHELGDVAVEAPDGFAHRLLIGADHVAHVLGIEPRREVCRIREIAEHHGQMAPLGARQLALGGKHGRRLGSLQGWQ